MGIPLLKIRRSRDRLIFNMGILILVRRHIYIERAPWWPPMRDEYQIKRQFWDKTILHSPCRQNGYLPTSKETSAYGAGPQPIYMMTSSNGNIFRVTGHLCGEITGHRWRPVTRSFDVSFDLRLNKRLSKQSWGWWFETPSCPLWCHCNE